MEITSSEPINQSISNVVYIQSEVEQTRKKQEDLQRKIDDLQKMLVEQQQELSKVTIRNKALQNLEKNTPPPEELHAPSDLNRKGWEKISNQIRNLVVQKVMYNGELQWEKAAALYGISRSSVARILREEKKRKHADEPIQAKKRGRKSPITIDALLHLLFLLEEDSTITLKQMLTEIENKFQISSSTSALDRALSKMGISWKNVLQIPYDWNTIEVITQRSQFMLNFQRYFQRPKIYIDESGFNLHIFKSKGRALSGEKAKLSLVPKGSRISLIAALAETGYVHYELFNSAGDKKRGVNADDFRSFLMNLVPKIPRNSVLVLDNCKIHHADLLEETWKMLKATYGIEHLFLPPYSPFLNPIEYSFNCLKKIVKNKEMFNRGDLINAIEQSIPVAITAEKSKKWFAKSAQYYEQCILGLPFKGRILKPDIAKAAESSQLQSVNSSISSQQI